MAKTRSHQGRKDCAQGFVLSEKEGETGGKAFAGYIIRLDDQYKQEMMVRSRPETNLGFKMKMRDMSC